MNKQQLLDHLKRDVYCRIKPSKISGVGVFAIKDISKGTNPFPGCENEVVLLSEDDIKDLDHELKILIHDFCAKENGMYYVPDFGLNNMNISFYLNHSKDPNINTNDGMTFVANKGIREGEELTVNYYTFYEDFKTNE